MSNYDHTPQITITSVEFRNFKALRHYSVKLQHMNILVGPNNNGKSTVLSAFQALVAGIRRARARNPERLHGPDGVCFGYALAEESLPISIENIHTDYADTDTHVNFRLSNGNELLLYFAQERGCILIPKVNGKRVQSTTDFKNAFPISIALIPVLGPVEHNEVLLDEETVRKGLATHRASRQFRNYWYYNPANFESFAELIRKTWPGMDIEAPQLDFMSRTFSMFCRENRIPRELYWSGFGFQVWCQLLTHVSRTDTDSLLIVDEPEVYLHPDVQRQLLSILREIGPDIILATHSTEIMGEADPSEIVLIDKCKRSGERLRDVEGVQAAYDLVGSVQNITLTRLARNRRLLFVEGLNDFTILRRFARKLGFTELASGTDLTPIESRGFSSWERIRSFAWGIETALRSSLSIATIFDRDYWSDEEVQAILNELREHLTFAHIHTRKEIENYLLIPGVLDRAISSSIAERVKRTGESIECPPATEILDKLTSPMRGTTQSQYIAKRSKYLEHSHRDSATITEETIQIFDSKWNNIHSRMEIVSGKDTLRAFRREIQENYGFSLTDSRLIDSFRIEDIPDDLCDLIQLLEDYRKNARYTSLPPTDEDES